MAQNIPQSSAPSLQIKVRKIGGGQIIPQMYLKTYRNNFFSNKRISSDEKKSKNVSFEIRISSKSSYRALLLKIDVVENGHDHQSF